VTHRKERGGLGVRWRLICVFKQGSIPWRSTHISCGIIIHMTKKTECTKCGTPLTESNRAKGRARCKACEAARMKSYYAANPELYNKHKGYVARNDAKWKAAVNTYILEVLKSRGGCLDCGETNIIVLEFDHRDPTAKSFSITSARQSKVSWDQLVEEIDKCDVVCANCHKIRSAKMFGNWRLDFLDEV
jgi:exonuclease III